MTHECPLRGWGEICELLRVQDRRTAKKILKDHHLLKYEGKTPVLLVSAYHKALTPIKYR